MIFFSFYGSKSKLARHYPKPKHNLIVEPFCGAAGYSTLYWDNDVILSDIDTNITSVWKYLISASQNDILSLPDVPNATRLEDVDGFKSLAIEEKRLIGFCANGGSATPKNVSGRHNFNSWNRNKIVIAENLYKIRHWKIYNTHWWALFVDIGNPKATWFIDPPYSNKGKYYRYGSNQIEYDQLGEWCQERGGQVIVCENYGADWLPFEPLKEIPFTHFKTEDDKKKKTLEAVWIKE